MAITQHAGDQRQQQAIGQKEQPHAEFVEQTVESIRQATVLHKQNVISMGQSNKISTAKRKRGLGMGGACVIVR